ncbi:hypothetical protein DC31_13750 [Microbacterium sp. CH12i]|uniref:hypothetical protein n=1 Tax=Microbacterium sp. CH12i TaxID=1479651 RepID=UPI0004617AA1|nr:hypothetical protein [Microbacterium sp. CH12i]KDA05550.1 hypothetical protein DC31_13750 [Microbacterium sp. CH12i]
MIVDQETGEVTENAPTTVELVPLNLAALNEDEIAGMFPTPMQCAAALLQARGMIAQAPAVLAARSKAVKDAKRELIVARGYARQAANGRDAETRRLVAESDAEVLKAWDRIDTAELALEYARERRKSLSEDIDILRSLNANFRGEHR